MGLGIALLLAVTPRTAAAQFIDAGSVHTCAILDGGDVKCWGQGDSGQLGYGNTDTIGDDANETPNTVGFVDLGSGRTAKQIAAGRSHTCAILDDDTIRCWGANNSGQLGYGNTNDIGDNEAPGTAGPVDLGSGRTAKQITAGDEHTCAILDDDTVRCWGANGDGQLGYGNTTTIGDTEAPAAAGPVDLGSGRTAKQIAAGRNHTCAVLDDDTLRCWGYGNTGELGYGNTEAIGDNETPAAAGPVDLGSGRTAKQVTGGEYHTCALLDDDTVRCWGYGQQGQLGYGNTDNVGGAEAPGTVGPVDLGSGRTAKQVMAGGYHTCAVLDDDTVRCWGTNDDGQLGYGNAEYIGDTEAPAAAGPVDLGSGRTARWVTAGLYHTCAVLDNLSVVCWGDGQSGQTGYGTTDDLGNDETPAMAGPVDLGALVLPVELASWDGFTDGTAVLLRWTTVSETNNAGFHVEHRLAGPGAGQAASWHALGFVAGAGTTIAPQAYTYRAEGLAPGTYRFRLRQVDFDGAFAYSSEVEVTVGLPDSHRLSPVYPNPFNPQTAFTLAVARRQHVTITVHDALGRRVATLQDGVLEAGASHRFTFEGTALASGTYLLRVASEHFQELRSLVLVK